MPEALARVAPLTPLSVREETVAVLVAHCHNYSDIGERLGISPRTVMKHAESASRKLPGDLPAQMKLAMWMRGAPLDVLTGAWLRSPLGAYRSVARAPISSSQLRRHNG